MRSSKIKPSPPPLKETWILGRGSVAGDSDPRGAASSLLTFRVQVLKYEAYATNHIYDS